jgi:hypothetical protein
LNSHFDGEQWSTNGPQLISRVLRSFCQVESFDNVSAEQCHGFKIIPVKNCLAIGYPEYNKFYSENNFDEVMIRLESTPFVHFWNKMGGRQNISIDSRVALVELAKKYCPVVIANSGGYI